MLILTTFIVIIQISCIRPVPLESKIPLHVIKRPHPVYYPPMTEILANPNFIRDRYKLYLRPILPPGIWDRYKTVFSPVMLDYCDPRHCNAYNRRACGVNLQKRSWKWFQSTCHLQQHNLCSWYRGTLEYVKYNQSVCYALQKIGGQARTGNGCPDCASEEYDFEYDGDQRDSALDDKLEGSNSKAIMLYLLPEPSTLQESQESLREFAPNIEDCDPRHCNAYHKRVCGVNLKHRAWRWFQSSCHLILHNECTGHTSMLPYEKFNTSVCNTLEKQSLIREGCGDCEPDGAPVCAVSIEDNRVVMFSDRCSLQRANCKKTSNEYEKVKLEICRLLFGRRITRNIIK